MSDRLFGYHGRMLVVDLTRQAWRLEPLSADMLRSVLGGTGLATRLLYDLTPPQADPLGPDNALLFVGSPLVGTPLTTTSKFTVASRSPLTGCIGDSLSSSHLALELKRCGCDAVVLLGAAARWSTVAISWPGPQEAQPTVRFLDATDLLGYDTDATAAARAGAARRTLAGRFDWSGRRGAGALRHDQQRRSPCRAHRYGCGHGQQTPEGVGVVRRVVGARCPPGGASGDGGAAAGAQLGAGYGQVPRARDPSPIC